jgi:hypothetical protein
VDTSIEYADVPPREMSRYSEGHTIIFFWGWGGGGGWGRV